MQTQGNHVGLMSVAVPHRRDTAPAERENGEALKSLLGSSWCWDQEIVQPETRHGFDGGSVAELGSRLQVGETAVVGEVAHAWP